MLLDTIIENTNRFLANVPKAKRKEYGQFFTTVQTARFMSNLFDFDLMRDEMRILDPGAGTGILSAAVIEKLSNEGYKGRVNLTCYETDPLVIECVTSVGPISAKRMLEINQMTSQVTCGKIYVTAFPDMATFKKFSDQLAWETEVWIAEMPDHMIHLNGDKFLGPR